MATDSQLITQLVLASASPFRKALLAAAGIAVEARTAPIDEHAVTAPTPRQTAAARAEAKALAVARQAPEALVIGADQVLALGDESFGKARSASEAAGRLAQLAGRTHYLHSGFALARGDRILHVEVVDLPMPMRPLSPAEIAAYVATGEWQGSVGCYQFENRGVQLFDGAVNDQSAVVGLPLQPLLAALRRLGVNPLLAPVGPWTLTGSDTGP